MNRVTGWHNTNSTGWVDCPRCKEPAGKACRTSKGRVTGDTHGERSGLYKQTYPERDYLYKGGPGIDHIGNVRAFNKKLEEQV